MIAATIEDWWPSELRLIAHLRLSRSEVTGLGDGLKIYTDDDGQDEVAVFRLDSGVVVALGRAAQSPIEGFTLMSTGDVDVDRILEDFLREAGLDRRTVTWLPELCNGD